MILNLLKVVFFSALLFVLGFFFSFQKEGPSNDIKNGTEKETVVTWNESAPVLEAKAACVFDAAKNEFIFELNSDAQLPLASLTKIMTAITAREYLLQTALVEISEEILAQEGDSGFCPGENWSLADLTDAMLVSSSNDAAFAIAGAAGKDFVKMMNKKAKDIGLTQTYFLNSTGLDFSEQIAGAYGSCRDMVNLAKYALVRHPQLLEVTTKESYSYGDIIFENTNKLLAKLPVLFGGKTGFSDLAGGNLIVVVDKGLGHPMILVVLGSTFDGRFDDTEVLYDKFVK